MYDANQMIEGFVREEISYAERMVTRAIETRSRIEEARERIGDVVEVVNEYRDEVVYASLDSRDLNIALSKQDSALPRAITMRCGINLLKSEKWDGTSIKLTGKLTDEFGIYITGYLPESCHVEYVEEEVPATVRTVAHVVCNESEDEDADLRPDNLGDPQLL